MTEPATSMPYGIHRAKVWLEMHGSAAVSMPMAEALASYAAPLEAAVKEADAQGDRLVLDLEHLTAERNALATEIEGEREGRLALRAELGAREDETFPAFLRRLAKRSDLLGAIEYDKGRDKPGSDEARFVVMCIHDKPHYAVPEIQAILDERDRRVRDMPDTTAENRIVERILNGVAEMICTALEMSGQGQAASFIRRTT